MSFYEPTSVDPMSRERNPDETDRLLREFFQAQMPDPWPNLEPPAQPIAAPAQAPGRRWNLVRSRLALAASIALLVGGHLFLSGTFRTDEKPRDDSAEIDENLTGFRIRKSTVTFEDGPDGKAKMKAFK